MTLSTCPVLLCCHRHLGMLSESEFVLKEALGIYKTQCGEVSVEVADTLASLSSTHNDRGTYNEGRYCVYMYFVSMYMYMYMYVCSS